MGDKFAMKIGDLVKVDWIGIGIVTKVYWDSEYQMYCYFIVYMDASTSWEEEDAVRLL